MAQRKARKAAASTTAVTLPPQPRSVYDKLRDGDYKNKLPYPIGPATVGLRTLRGQPVVDKDEVHLEGAEREAARKAYREEESRLAEVFKADALAEVGLTGHPKADKVYSLATEYGHSAGFSEVMNYLPDLADLVK
jgi:hypothetical protein